MRNLWFTSDTHFSHKKIPLYAKRYFCLNKEEQKIVDSIWMDGGPTSTSTKWSRWAPSWESISKMNDYLINKINECVKKDDILWHLGDYSFSPKSKVEEYAGKIRSRINCKNIYLTWGNHDSKKIGDFFKECHERHEFSYKQKNIIVSHYAQAVWNKSHYGSWMLYGHSHATAEEWLDNVMPGRLSMDVGVDNIYKILGEYRPISFEEIYKIFEKRTGISIDNGKKSI
jgi:calcineurin-like phosphoesterase family protein